MSSNDDLQFLTSTDMDDEYNETAPRGPMRRAASLSVLCSAEDGMFAARECVPPPLSARVNLALEPRTQAVLGRPRVSLTSSALSPSVRLDA